MSGTGTIKFLSMYEDYASTPAFLTAMFRTPPENYFDTEEVEIDVRRGGVKVAVAVVDITSPANRNENTQTINKTWTPAIYKESASFSVYELLKRQAGMTAYDTPDKAAIANHVLREIGELENKIRRAIEIQASQVLQTGQLALLDASGNSVKVVDYKPKATHFVTVSNDWNGSSSTKLADLESLALQVRRDGKKQPGRLTFGRLAWQDFIADAEVQARLENRRMEMGIVNPQMRPDDATFQGFIKIGSYNFEMWTYDGYYEDPQTSTDTPYITDDNVIMTSPGARLDLVFGSIPRIPGAQTPSALQYIPARMSMAGRGIDLSTFAFFGPDGTTLTVQAGTRPLCIPTAIDTFGCLNTRI
jgi:hypothetical protein